MGVRISCETLATNRLFARLAEVAASRAATSARCASSSNTPCMLTSPAHRTVAATSAITRSSTSCAPVGGGGQRHAEQVGEPAGDAGTRAPSRWSPRPPRRPAHARAITGITANQTRPGERSPPLASENVTATAPTSHSPRARHAVGVAQPPEPGR